MFNRILSLVLTAVALLSCSSSSEIEKGDRLPDFSLTSQKFGTMGSADLEGKVVYICFFATWCSPCQEELAAIQSTLLEELSEEEDFRLVVIAREHTDEDIEEYIEQKGFTFPIYPDPKREVYSLFAQSYIPRAYLVDKEGVIRKATVGYDDMEFAGMILSARKLLEE